MNPAFSQAGPLTKIRLSTSSDARVACSSLDAQLVRKTTVKALMYNDFIIFT
jgi:hypothetical protein